MNKQMTKQEHDLTALLVDLVALMAEKDRMLRLAMDGKVRTVRLEINNNG